jgi:acyl-CoA thioesterase
MSSFLTDTAVRRVDGPANPAAGDRLTYRARIDGSWWIVMGPNGGYVAAIVARAAVDAVGDPARRLHSITLHYLRPPVEGECHVTVDVERVGRGLTTVTIRMTQGDMRVVVGVAALAVHRDSIVLDQLERPDVAAPETISVPEGQIGMTIPMAQHFDNRPVFGHRLGGGDPPELARTGGWMRYRESTPIDEIALLALCDAWWPPMMEVIEEPMAVPTVDLTVHIRALPEDPTDAVLGEFVSPLAADGYTIEDARLWSRSGRLLAESRQLAVLI